MTWTRAIRRTATWVTRAVAAVIACAVIVLGSAHAIISAYGDGTGTLPADCAIVFGAAIYGLDKPSPALTRRIAAASDLYREGRVGRLILSGGKGEGGRLSEAQVMQVIAREHGVPDVDITLESDAHSTWENIAFSQNLTSGCERVVGISDQYHLARIEFLSWRQGWPELQTIPAQNRQPLGTERRWLVREVFALIYYGLYLDTFIPKSSYYWVQG